MANEEEEITEEEEKSEEFKQWKAEFDKQQEEASYKGRVKKELKPKVKQTFSKIGEVKKTSRRINPLKGLVQRRRSKGRPGRPRKYAPQPQSQRPVGRPRNVMFSLSRRPIVSNERMMGESPVRFGPQQQQREPFVEPSQTQIMMNQILGQSNQTWGFGGNPVRINHKLNSGQGIIKNDDGGATGSFFGRYKR